MGPARGWPTPGRSGADLWGLGQRWCALVAGRAGATTVNASGTPTTMNHPLRLVLVLHNHQPVGNFDGVFEQLYDQVPENTYVIVTADHGELFGEAGYFGHGPIMHEKCFEVPFVEGALR